MELSITTPALLFPAITLLMLAYTNRFLALASLVRTLHSEYHEEEKNPLIQKQIKNLHIRIGLIRNMQGFGVLSFVFCVVCMFLIFNNYMTAAKWIFAFSLLSLLTSLIYSLIEIVLSTRAIDLVLSDMELGKKGLIKSMLDGDEPEK